LIILNNVPVVLLLNPAFSRRPSRTLQILRSSSTTKMEAMVINPLCTLTLTHVFLGA